MSGWLKIHRKLREHWLWNDPIKLQWWLIMLFEVNFKNGKILLGNSIHEIKVGESGKSLRNWALLFGCGTKAVSNFFDVLEKEAMISKKIIGKGKQSTTLINITNYLDYQVVEETQEQHKPIHKPLREGHTIEERKKERKKEVIKLKFNYKAELLKFVSDEQLVDDYISMRKTKKAPQSKTALDLLKNECDKNNFPLEEALKICIKRNWQGFQVDWIQKDQPEEKAALGRMTATTANNSLAGFIK